MHDFNISNMQIFVKTFLGKNVVLDVDQLDNVYSIKQKIRNKEGVPEKEQRLIYGGKQLEDDKILKDYNIQEHSTIHLALRLLGG